MKKWLKVGLLVLVAFGPQVVWADDAGEIKAAMTAMWAALEQGDIEAYGQYVHPDYTLFGEGDIYLAKGKDVELRAMADWVGRATGVHTEMHQPEVTVRGDTAWVTYYWTDAGYVGKERFTTRGKSTRIFVREAGKWLCIHGHFTDVP